MSMTAERRAEIAELARKATPGPWFTDDPWIVATRDAAGAIEYLAATNDLDTGNDQQERDAAFIAACDPQTILALLDRIAELEDAS